MWPPVVSRHAWTAAGSRWAVSCPVGCLGVQTADTPGGGLSSRAVPAACRVVKVLSTSLPPGTRSPTQAPRASLSPSWSRPFGGPGLLPAGTGFRDRYLGARRAHCHQDARVSRPFLRRRRTGTPARGHTLHVHRRERSQHHADPSSSTPSLRASVCLPHATSACPVPAVRVLTPTASTYV